MKNLTSRTELEELQIHRLRDTLKRASGKVDFYSQAAKTAGLRLESDDAELLASFKRIPFTTKSDLRDHYPLGLLAVDRSKLRRIHASSGTRGKPTIAAYTDEDLRNWSELCARSLRIVGVQEGDIVQNSYGYGLFTGGLGLHQGIETLGAVAVPASSGRSQQQLLLLQDFGARVLCCTPSYALTLAAYVEEQKLDRKSLKLEIGVFGAEPWSEECRAQIELKLGIKAYDIYGLSEVMGPGVAMECTEQCGLHIWEDHFLVEIINPETGEAAARGEVGELVITTLTKEAMPLLRYRTGDACALIEGNCQCGSPFRRITKLQGRIDDMLIVRGVNVYPSELESIVYSMPQLGNEYQIIVDRVQTLDTLTLRVEMKPELDEPVRRRESADALENLIKQRFGLTARIEIVEPNVIPRSEGKALRVLDMRTN